MPPVLQQQSPSKSTVERIPVDDATLSADLGFLWDLIRATGEGLKAMKPRIADFKKRYGLDATSYSQVVATYRDKNDGPSNARRKLVAAAKKKMGVDSAQEIES